MRWACWRKPKRKPGIYLGKQAAAQLRVVFTIYFRNLYSRLQCHSWNLWGLSWIYCFQLWQEFFCPFYFSTWRKTFFKSLKKNILQDKHTGSVRWQTCKHGDKISFYIKNLGWHTTITSEGNPVLWADSIWNKSTNLYFQGQQALRHLLKHILACFSEWGPAYGSWVNAEWVSRTVNSWTPS